MQPTRIPHSPYTPYSTHIHTFHMIPSIILYSLLANPLPCLLFVFFPLYDCQYFIFTFKILFIRIIFCYIMEKDKKAKALVYLTFLNGQTVAFLFCFCALLHLFTFFLNNTCKHFFCCCCWQPPAQNLKHWRPAKMFAFL